MNCVLRVETATRSFIVKQSRGYVEIPSSSSLLRAYHRRCFYQKIALADTVQQIMPKLLGIDAINNMIALEDLGKMISLFYMMKKENYKNRNSTN
jgi:5-methylthioribose kinase